MKTIHVEISDERLITPSGLVFVGQILGKSDFVKKINRAPISDEYLQKQIKNGDVLLTYIGMLCQGKPQYEAVREMMDDPRYFKYALGVTYAIPSAETLRQRFDMIGDTYREYIQQANVDIFREMNIEPSALENGYVPVDIDVTPFDNSKTQKEGVSRTYKGFDGYAPIMAYIGTEGYLVNTELRAGKQHCQSEIKTDMDVERLPSGKFDSNKLVLELTMIAYNILRIIGQESLKKRDDPGRKRVKRRRIRTVISNLMQFAGHLTEHAGRMILAIGKSNSWRFTFMRLYKSFAMVT